MSFRPWPPFRYYVACLLVAAVIVYIEKATHITAGGVGGLAIAVNGFSDLSVGVLSIAIKFILFGVVYWLGGLRTTIWTIVSALLIGAFVTIFELLPLPYTLPVWLAFVLLLTVAYFPTGLLLANGYSTGGFTSIAQVLSQKHHIPIWLTMLVGNGGIVVLMLIAFGHVSGLLTLIATLWQGTSIQLWTKLCKRWFTVKSTK